MIIAIISTVSANVSPRTKLLCEFFCEREYIVVQIKFFFMLVILHKIKNQ